MDGRPPIECTCGAQNFERVVVRRPNGARYTTDFLACVECKVMYFDPKPPPEPRAVWTAVGPTDPSNLA